ncbi:MAG: M56 family metallopeptidase [Gemmatimonadales bacterium]
MTALILKATLVFLLGGLAALLLHRRSAALRHLVWTATLAGALSVAVASPLLPDFRLRLKGWPSADPLESEKALTTVNDVASAAIEASGPVRTAAAPLRPSSSRTIQDLLPAFWLAGTLAILGWCVLGRLGLARLLRRAAALREPDWLASLEERRLAAGVAPPVRLFISPAVGSPATWGLLRPVIVLPPDAVTWSAERRRVVLAHELAHIARGEGIANLIGWAACALYWWHPLVWLASRRLRIEAERAADDHVLARGVPAVEYAAHLLDVARGSRAMRLLGASAIGMARPSTLEGRLLAVLDDTRSRLVPRVFTRRATWLGLAGVVLPLAAVAPSAEGRREPAAGAAMEERFQAPADTTLEQSYPARPGETLTLDLETGGSVRIEGWDEPTVRIRVRVGGMSWRQTTVEIAHRGPGIHLVTSLVGPRGTFSTTSTSRHFDIRVPRRYDLRIESSGGDLTILGVEGTFSGHTGGGAITIRNAKGSATLRTGGGEVEVSDSELEGRVTTGGGIVRVSRVSGNFRGSSGSGPVIRVGDNENEKGDLRGVVVEKDGRKFAVNEIRGADRGTLHIEKAGGGIDLDRAPNGAQVRTGGGEIRIGEGAGLVRARGFDGRFDLETAYTRSHGGTRIVSDWELYVSETQEWDSSQGTPRRYVRATGRAGNGSGHILVRLVNGNITVRRAR